ncbi:GH23365 [Drosophila grimshawi]|uniref:GH23365 n=1 Tax=Drosophila grimshawi TaxID=7222 RepID=B4K258_DROGR|nr:GH23365 [Drosophila grimshawi]
MQPTLSGTQISLALDTQTNETSEVNPLRMHQAPSTTISTTTTIPPSSSNSSSTHCPKETTTTTTTTTTSPSNGIKDTTTTTESLTTREQDPDTEEPSWWQDTSLQINTASALDYNNRSEMPYRLRHIDSGDDHAWWLRQDATADEDDTLAEETLNPLDDEHEDVSAATEEQNSRTGGWWSSSKDDNLDESKENQTNLINGHGCGQESEHSEEIKRMPRSHISPEQDAWWLEEQQEQQEQQQHQHQQSKQNGYHEDVNNNEPHVEVTIKLPSSTERAKNCSSSSHSGESAPPWWQTGPAKKLFNVQRVESGERAWWQEEKENEPPPVKPPTPPPRIIKHWESGERAWWLQDEEPKNKELPQPATDEVDHEDQQDLLNSSFNFTYSVRPPPLGQCASPVPVEPQQKLCESPYDNIPMSKVQMAMPPSQSQSQSTSAPAPPPRYSYNPPRVGDKLFISRHQNIDELLGGACRPLSPLFYSGAVESDASASALPLASKNMFLLEEITPDQVRIHDSTAQLPVIQRMQR